METAVKKLNIKFEVLNLVIAEIPRVLKKNKLGELTKCLETIEQKTEDLRQFKLTVQELKLEEEADPKNVHTWGEEIETKLENTLKAVEPLEHAIKEMKSRETKEEEDRVARQKDAERSRRFDEERELEELRIKLRKEAISDKASELHGDGTVRARLPKLTITPFKGTFLDWQRFWSQFEADVDQKQLPCVTKLSYLRELVEPKVQCLINGLPFTTEGYARAKSLLKAKYGRPSEVANAHIQAILALPTVYLFHRHPSIPDVRKIHEFYEKLLCHVQALETMGKLDEIKGYVRMTLDKLPDIRADLVRTSDVWQDWNYEQLLTALRQWTERNPLPSNQRNTRDRTQLLQTNNRNTFHCVYCESASHKSFECDSINTVAERKRILSTKKLCFNCTKPFHHANDCKSTNKCKHCQRRHHSSICEEKEKQMNERAKDHTNQTPTMMASEDNPVVYPVVVVYVNGVKCRALLDTGAGASYASSFLLSLTNTKPERSETKTIEMMMGCTTTKLEIFNVTVENLKKTYSLKTKVNKVNRKVLLNLPNPNYEKLKQTFAHLKNVELNDYDTKPELPIHLVLGTGEYTRIKTDARPKIGEEGEPVAELTRFGWTIMSAGRDTDITGAMLTQTSSHDYERLCSLDVLGLKDTDDQREVLEEFRSQLRRDPEGFYETGLIWKTGHPPLPTNKQGSLGRLNSLVKKLKSDETTFNEYDEIIQQQLEEGIIEEADEKPLQQNKEHYIPHKPVIRPNAESTKLRVVYDASAAINGVSLNSCLETGPNLQCLLWSVLVRERLQPIALCADIRKAFLQIRIKEEDRDVLRFHWIRNRDSDQVTVYRFTRALFGLTQSPFLLQGTIHHHMLNYDDEIRNKINEDLYVDDVISGAQTVEDCLMLKETLIKVFGDASFTLHKWHSNVNELETQVNDTSQDSTTFAKEQLKKGGVPSSTTSILGLQWNKETDELSIRFPDPIIGVTKRTILHQLASIYDPLGITGPFTLQGKLLFREICDLKLRWDEPVEDDFYKRWIKWENSMPKEISVPRAFNMSYSTIKSIDIHTFADASKQGVCATLYVNINQVNGDSHQGILTAKCRLAKKDLTIPRQELIAAHMASNITANVIESLNSSKTRKVICWTDSTVVLHWLKSERQYKAFVTNRVRKIKEKNFITWRHVPTDMNPADLGSRGGKIDQKWLQGPRWLQNEREWPENIVTKETEISETEATKMKEVLATTIAQPNNVFNALLEKHPFWRFVRITTWVRRFVNNCRGNQTTGPLTTEEIELQTKFLMKSTQQQYENNGDFQSDKEKFNLQKDADGIYVCCGRIMGNPPIYLPHQALLTEKIIDDAHRRTLHGGVGLTMAKIRENLWIPRLRSLAKKAIHRCHGCKRFHAIAFPAPPPGNLPPERTTPTTKPFKIIGLDYAGPFTISLQKKVHVLLFSCSVSRAIHLELLLDQATGEFIKAMKRLIARRGLPSIVYSDNAKTFHAGAKWLKRVLYSNDVHNFSARQGFQWRFNLSRAPWWGGQFERLVGLVKQALYKSVNVSSLSFDEFEDILLDIETTLNNRPLGYIEEDVQQTVLTPNKMIHGEDVQLPEEDVEVLDEDAPLRKRLKYLKRCKDEMWKRWQSEYMTSLRERHNMKHNTKMIKPDVGDIVLLKGDSKNRGNWSIGVVKQLMPGKDNVLRAVRVRCGAYDLERAIQHLYPLELHCDVYKQANEERALNPQAREYVPRRNTAAIAELLNKDIFENMNTEPEVED